MVSKVMSDPRRLPCDLLVRSATHALDGSCLTQVRSLTVSAEVKISESIHTNPALWRIQSLVIYLSMNKTSHIRFPIRSFSHVATHWCQTPAVREVGISQSSKIKVVVCAFFFWFLVSFFLHRNVKWSGGWWHWGVGLYLNNTARRIAPPVTKKCQRALK